MNVQCTSDLISEVNSQPLVNATENTNQTSSEQKSCLMSSSLSELTQQTLIDVNSQPFTGLDALKDNNTLLAYQAFNNSNNSNDIAANDRVLTFYPSVQSTPSVDHSAMITEFYERFATGRMFPSLADLRTAAYEYGKKYNVALTTSKSDKTKVYLICKHGGQYRQNDKRDRKNSATGVASTSTGGPTTITTSLTDKQFRPRVRRSQKTGCECMIYARCSKDSFWMIRKSIAEHNHPIAEDPRAYAMYRSLSPENLLVVHRLLRERVGVSHIVKSLRACGVTNVIAKDIENIQQDMKRRDVIPVQDSQQVTTDLDKAQNILAAIEANHNNNTATENVDENNTSNNSNQTN
ncbi:hypothetical protein G6F43_011028 [Rhizopus delemar]|nr:hypothetical protein G6F43_011028 [Rhizopus delemar]